MTSHARALIAALALLFGGMASAEAGWSSYPDSIEEALAEIENLPWERKAGVYRFDSSNSKVKLRNGQVMVHGDDARRFMFLNQGGAEFPDTEAVIVKSDPFTQIILAYVASGYVPLDDWDDVDSTSVLQSVRQETNAGNIQRRRNGFPELNIKGWVVEPTLDRDKNAVYWAFEANEGGQGIINATVLNLGRKGFERITWVGASDQYGGSGFMNRILEAHTFQTEYRFADYVEGDELAGFGIASLVALTASGQKVAGKVSIGALIAGLLALGKKFIIVPILLVFGAIGAFLRGARKSEEA